MRSRKRVRKATFRPIVEQLEDRCTPSALPAGAIQISASPAPKLGYEFTGTVGQAFTSETLSAETRTAGGVYVNNNDYGFYVPNGYSMPPGLNLSSSGSLYGTPTAPGQYNVPIAVSDGGTYYDSTVYQFLISPQSTTSPTTPTWSVGTTMQPLTALNALQYNNQTLPLGVVDQPYNATVTATNSNDPIAGVNITTYLTSANIYQAPLTPMGASTLGGIDVQKSTTGNTTTYSIYGLDSTTGPALTVTWTAGSDQVSVSGTPTFSAAGQSYPLFLSLTFQDGTTHNFNFAFGNSPQELESAYDFNGVGNGAGQTIVILESGRVPNLVSSNDPNFANSDLNQFDQIFPGLSTFGQPGGPAFLKVNATAGSIYGDSDFGVDKTDVTEEVQDIEWAHALAPMANIVDIDKDATLYDTNPTQFFQNLVNQGLPTPTNTATTTIASTVTLPTSTTIDVSSTAGFPTTGGYLLIQTLTGTTVVQYTSTSPTAFMGCTGTGGTVTLQAGDKVTFSTLYVVGTSGVGTLQNSTQQPGVTFVDSSGDDIVNNQLNNSPATNGNVVFTGYTLLTQSPTSSYVSESAVFGIYDPFRSPGLTLGSGGAYNDGSQQPFQAGIYSQLAGAPSIGRAGPDVSFNGSPLSGDIEFNSAINSLTDDSKSPGGKNQDFGGAPSEDAWGTSITSPSWDALLAIANQGRAALGKASLSGITQTLPMLYSLAGTSAFNQISTSDSTVSSTTVGNLTLTTSAIPGQVQGSDKDGNINTYTSYGSGIYNTLAGLGSPVVANLIPTLIGPSLTPSSGVWAASIPALTITGSDFVADATYSVSFNNPNVTGTVTYSSPTTLIVSNMHGLSGLAPGTPLIATVTMIVPVGSTSYTDTTGAPVQVATIPKNLSNTIYVGNLYTLLLHRSPDSGAATWVNLLNAGTPPATVIQDIEQSPEYLNDVVTALYQHYLNRAPDPGAQGWVTALENGSTIEQVIAGIVSSPEFFQDAGSTDSGYVNALYNLILGRAADTAGYNSWLNALSSGTSSAAVAMGFLTSTEYRQDLVAGVGWTPGPPAVANPPSSYFQGYYVAFLNRAGDSGGVASWLAALETGMPDQEVLAGILGSPEGYSKWS